MSSHLFPIRDTPCVAVEGETATYPIARIFCVGRNYAAHAAEMGSEVDREAPFYFTKSAYAFQSGGTAIAYPPGTENFHYEMELVLAIGKPVFKADANEASKAIFAYGCGLDMTRRDLQQKSKDNRRPWDTAKDCEQSAVIAPLKRADGFGSIGSQRIHLSVNGETRQDAKLSDMVWKVEEIVSHLSGLYHLEPGDLIMTGTPAGVGPVTSGDKIVGGIDGLADVVLDINPPE